jgi:hypothetical protein
MMKQMKEKNKPKSSLTPQHQKIQDKLFTSTLSRMKYEAFDPQKMSLSLDKKISWNQVGFGYNKLNILRTQSSNTLRTIS